MSEDEAGHGRDEPVGGDDGFEEWAGVIMAAALIDRLLHHCHIVNIRGNSYWMRAY